MAEPLAVTGRPTRGGLAPTPTSRRAREGSTIPNVSHVDDGRLGTGLQAESAVAESLVNAEGTGVGGGDGEDAVPLMQRTFQNPCSKRRSAKGS